ncbi:LLM class flavin-dependent oxidoreductase [Chitinophaga agrisoli]|uniref:LLM class flavin-dependent oxidoreductase n=1 Tax=Chitinophaga agrisoli TaxID=2607653 RepID=A0A5B2W416_9BACT|nr:Atu2307/SP_0267 family LLM class monooxygenase [Chitinophaga agrisoli]KAA2245450.1 LLM class flavin-dependent oxidoreductase [Chitinophaga agrisoli]
MEIGISTFGEVVPEGVSGGALDSYLRMQEIIAEAKLADKIGLDVYAVGEHHRPDYMISSPEVVLGAIATVTEKIRLSSSVTVLSSADPVRVFQQFATVDLLSGGRAEILAGRGSFIESFPLFGYNLADYDALFEEKLQMLLEINRQEQITWRGKFRSPIGKQGIYPRPLQPALPIWLGVGGTQASAMRAGKLNIPMTMAILGSPPRQFISLVNLYRQTAKDAGHDPEQLQLAVNSQCYIADSADQAGDEFFPTYAARMNKVGKERGWQPLTREYFDYMCMPEGPLFVGSVQDVIEKIIYQHGLFKHTRFLAQLVKGEIPHEKIMRTIELLGSEVAPAVREALG